MRLGALFGGALDAALQPQDLRRELAIGRAFEKGVDPALELDGADRIGRQAQPYRADRIGQQRDRLQVRQNPPLGLAVRMADIVADLDALAGHRALAGHAVPHFRTHGFARAATWRARERGFYALDAIR